MSTSLTGNNNFPKSFGDSRDDLGYGRLSTKYHKDRSLGGSSFPYREPPEDLSDVEIEEELIDLVSDKTDMPIAYDPITTLDSEGQYYASGNTKFMETYDMMSPIPGLYKNRMKSGSGPSAMYPAGATSGFSSRIRPTGSKYGYSTMYNDSDESDEPVYTIEDLAEKQLQELRDYIRSLLLTEFK